jgi:N6-adenosine-specific RNA methylase IME4
MAMTPALPDNKYSIIYADPPYHYYGDPNKNAAAGKHYSLMTTDDICKMLVPKAKKAVLFLWATGPKMPEAIRVMKEWGFHYKGVAWVWVKTNKAGKIIQGQGVRPTFVKPTTEFVLVGGTNKRGRTFPILDEGMGQVVLAPREEHSKKPDIIRDRIVELLGDLPRIELFARQQTPGWTSWGNEVPNVNDIV